jgi:hypothetical protein
MYISSSIFFLCLYIDVPFPQFYVAVAVGGHGQLISNGEWFKPAFAEERDKKQTMIDLRGISTSWFKNKLCPSPRLSRLRAR